MADSISGPSGPSDSGGTEEAQASAMLKLLYAILNDIIEGAKEGKSALDQLQHLVSPNPHDPVGDIEMMGESLTNLGLLFEKNPDQMSPLVNAVRDGVNNLALQSEGSGWGEEIVAAATAYLKGEGETVDTDQLAQTFEAARSSQQVANLQQPLLEASAKLAEAAAAQQAAIESQLPST